MTHEQLWAPWRLSYILNNKEQERPSDEEGCFLCRYRDQSLDAENYVVQRGTHSLVVLNRFPYNNGHLLVAPLRHKSCLKELDDAELLDCMRHLRQMTTIIGELLSPDGYNIGLNLGRVAGAGLPGHLHWHLVPRWSGDTSFMPVLADVNVIPQSLEALYEYLKEAVQRSDS